MSALLDWMFGNDAEIARGQALDAQIAAGDKERLDNGTWTQEQYDHGMADLSNNSADTYSSQLDGAFVEGWTEGKDKLTGGIKGVFNGLGGFVWDAVPLWVWIGAAIYVLWWFGAIGKNMFKRQ